MRKTIPADVWYRPEDLLAIAEAEGRRLSAECRVRSDEGKPYREAFMAAHFARARGASAVRLIPEAAHDTPDFALLFAGQERVYENTEADDPHRHRGEDYEADCARALTGGLPMPLPSLNLADYAAEIRRIVTQKCNKTYQHCDGLVLRSNAAEVPGLAEQPLTWWEDACAPAAHRFAETWIWRDGLFHRLFVTETCPQ